jgi:outer membrane protein assembly factor BamE
MRFLRLLPLLPLLAACSNMQVPEVTSVVTPYRIDIRQGNYISQEMVAQLKPGMSRDQVRFLLGTPLVTDIFHADRWDYIYRFKPGRGELQQRRLAVFFEDNKLVRVAGDVTGAEAGEAPGRRRSRRRGAQPHHRDRAGSRPEEGGGRQASRRGQEGRSGFAGSGHEIISPQRGLSKRSRQ